MNTFAGFMFIKTVFNTKRKMKRKPAFLMSVSVLLLAAAACTSQKELAYLGNLSGSEERFLMEIPEYKIQSRDILYITARAMTPDGYLNDFLMSARTFSGSTIGQNEGSSYLYGYEVNRDGFVVLPVVGVMKVSGLTLEETRKMLQEKVEKIFPGATVECKLLSYKFTVIGEVRAPGTYINYNNYLTVLEAIGRAGGIGDYGRRDRVLVLRPANGGTVTYTLNLQDKKLLSEAGYFLLPNDVVIVEPMKHKIFNLNLPVISLIITSVTSAVTTTILLLNYFGK